MNTGSAEKKRIREEQELNLLPEDSCKQKQARLMEFEAGMTCHKDENAGAGNENLPEFCSLSNEYSMLLLKDSRSLEDRAGFAIRSIAIRKQSYILDYLQDSAVDKSTEEEVAEQQVEEDCLRGSLFEAIDDQLWRPQSPVTEALFSLDFNGSHDCTTLLQDESIIAQDAASCFRIWDQDDDHKGKQNDTGLVWDWISGTPLDQTQFSESVEFENSLPSL